MDHQRYAWEANPSSAIRMKYQRASASLLACIFIYPVASHDATELASEPNGTQAPRQQIEIREEFRATGDEPTFWASFARSDFARVPHGESEVHFNFDLREIEAIIGGKDAVRFVVDSGADRLTVTQNPATQAIALEGGSSAVSFLNALTQDLQPRSGSWTQTMLPFDDSVIPGMKMVQTDVRCSAEILAEGRAVYTLLQFEAGPLVYEVAGAQVSASFRGLAIVDTSRERVFHSFFQQAGTVRNGQLTSDFTQLTCMTLINELGQPAMLLEGRTQELVDLFLFRPRPDTEQLDPDVFDSEVKPVWSTPVWLAGRVAESSMGLMAEQGTNPMPVASLSGLVLTDQVLGYAGNILYDYLLIEQDALTLEEIDPSDNAYLSPLQRTYNSANDTSDRLDERLSLLGPETTGSARVGDDHLIAIGVAMLFARSTFSNAPQSNLSFATSSTNLSAASVVGGSTVAAASASAAVTAGVGSALLIAGGTALAIDNVTTSGGPGLASGPGGDDNGAGAVLNLFETQPSPSCFVGVVRLTVNSGPPQAVWSISGTGDIQACPNETAGTWQESASGVFSSSPLVIEIPLPNHQCIDGTITVRVNEAPAAFQFQGSIATGSVSSTCF